MDIKRKFMSDAFVPTPLAECYYEYECGQKSISVVGSLNRHVGYWEQVGAPEYILNILRCGYTIPLKYIPSRKKLRNNFSSRNDPAFVRLAIDKLVHTRAVSEVTDIPTVVNPLTVSYKNGKARLVLDLRHVNKAVLLQRCKIEGAETFLKYLTHAKFLFGFDLKAGYHHLDINPIQRQYLGFSYTDHTGQTRYFVFNVLPFGLNIAGFIFTKVLRVLVHLWRSHMINIVTFFDDGMAAGTSYEETLQHSSLVRTSLLSAGYIPNATKSNWTPVAILAWLGVLLQHVHTHDISNP